MRRKRLWATPRVLAPFWELPASCSAFAALRKWKNLERVGSKNGFVQRRPASIFAFIARPRRRPRTAAEEYLSRNWHTDCSPTDSLKVLIVASDVAELDGPTHLLDREGTHKVTRMGFHHRRDYRMPIEVIENPQTSGETYGTDRNRIARQCQLVFPQCGRRKAWAPTGHD
jgi:hypothetical protein